jgi:hypothetical protein
VASCLRGLMICAAMSAAACAPGLTKLPSVPGSAAADAAAAFTDATRTCREVRTLTAEIGASGKAAGQRFRARLAAGLVRPASIRLEAVAPFGPPLFILAAVNDDATLLLPREDRVLERQPAQEVLGAVAGVPLSAADLTVVLTGCREAPSPVTGRELGPDWRMIVDGARDGYIYYLHRAGAAEPWRVVVAMHSAWRVDYRDWVNGLPRTLRLSNVKGDDVVAGSTFDLTLSLSQVETNAVLGPEVFRIDVPRDARPITVDELRRQSALAPAKPRTRP